MNKILKINPPVFIPKLIQNEAGFVIDKKTTCVMVDANIVASYKKPISTIKNCVDNFIIDPATNFFIESQYQNKSTFKKLKTSPQKPYQIEALLTDENLRKEQMVWSNMKNQIDNGASLIIIPYVYSDSIEDTKFGINLSMISDAIKIAEREKIDIPLYAMINLGANLLNDYSRLDNLLERYCEDFNDKISGFFLMFNSFDCKKANEESLLGLAYLTFNLSNNKKVFPVKIGDYGEILCAIGASGYGSGLAQGETFNADGLFKKIFARGRKHKEITYVPELFNYLYDEELRKIGYFCDCNFCNHGIPKSYNDTKAHFLARKLARMEKLASLTKEQRIDFMILKIEEAINLATNYNLNFALDIKIDFLKRWKTVLEKSKYWSYSLKKSDEIDLDKIIEEAKQTT